MEPRPSLPRAHEGLAGAEINLDVPHEQGTENDHQDSGGSQRRLPCDRVEHVCPLRAQAAQAQGRLGDATAIGVVALTHPVKRGKQPNAIAEQLRRRRASDSATALARTNT